MYKVITFSIRGDHFDTRNRKNREFKRNWTKGFNSEDSEPLIPEHVVNNWDLSEWTW